jgi:peptidoglycan/LPS O-acetylase OafA/YrhL
MQVQSRTHYRADIDGLRAVAVLLVIGYHAFPTWVRGGFIGVDVFFVISGFLITSIIQDDLATDTFSFAGFYARRIKRIFPALIVVLLCAFIVGWFELLPYELKQLGKHIAAGAGFSSNFALWSERGYFDDVAQAKPLVHLWSLGIEEQFYLLWPVLLFAIWRNRWNFTMVAGSLAALSLCLSVIQTAQDQTAAFYSPLSRLWELALGGLVSRIPAARLANNAPWRSLISLLGCAMGGFAAIFLTSEAAFPGWWAILPAMGTALIIAAGPHAAVNRNLLSNKMLVGIGLFSYPLYLWHWPLLSAVWINDIGTPAPATRIAVVSIAFVLGWATYRFIELPIRGRPVAFKLPAVLFSAMLATGMAGYAAYAHSGFPGRRDMAENMTEEAITAERARYWNGANSRSFEPGRPRIVIFGDSQAFDIYSALANDTRLGLRLFASPAFCGSLFSAEAGKERRGKECMQAFQALLASPELAQADSLIYTHYWVPERDNTDDPPQAVRQILEKNPKLKIFFFGPKPYLTRDFNSMAKIARTHHSLPEMDAFLNQIKWIAQARNDYVRTLAAKAGVEFVDVIESYCGAECHFYIDGSFLYFDHDHWTAAGASYFEERFHTLPVYARLLQQRPEQSGRSAADGTAGSRP